MGGISFVTGLNRPNTGKEVDDINVISIGQKLMGPIQFQSFPVLLDPPDGMFQSKIEKQW
jgi:hypothetical protein